MSQKSYPNETLNGREFASFSFFQFLTLYAIFCSGTAFLCNLAIVTIPGVAFYIMNTIVGVNEEIAYMCLTPLIIFAFIAPFGKMLSVPCC